MAKSYRSGFDGERSVTAWRVIGSRQSWLLAEVFTGVRLHIDDSSVRLTSDPQSWSERHKASAEVFTVGSASAERIFVRLKSDPQRLV
jgi:hypothetical protein